MSDMDSIIQEQAAIISKQQDNITDLIDIINQLLNPRVEISQTGEIKSPIGWPTYSELDREDK